MKQRQERMAMIVRKAVGEKLVELLPQANLTVTNVAVSPDLRHASVSLSTLKLQKKTKILDEIEQRKKDIQAELASQVESKFVPRISFYFDEGHARADRIDEILREIGK